MNKKRVWRYYCEFCKKSGCSAGHIKHHEEHCTMNPMRKCGFCEYAGVDNVSIIDSLKALKQDIIEYKKIHPFIKSTTIDTLDWRGNHETLEMMVCYSVPINNLRDATDGCPACMLAAIRQSGMHKHIEFDFKKEKEMFWAGYNEAQSRDDKYNYLYSVG